MSEQNHSAAEEPDLSKLSSEVIDAIGMPMPFGKFKGTRLIDLPEPYVVWFKGRGFPPGKLGERLALIYEIKANGLEKLLRPVLEASLQAARPAAEKSPDRANTGSNS